MLKFVILVAFLFGAASAGNFNTDVTVTWGAPRAQIQNRGQLMSMSLDNTSGCGWESKNQFLRGRFDVQLKLVPNNSAGTVTTFFVSPYSYMSIFLHVMLHYAHTVCCVPIDF